jgi:hypothetical protein
MSINFPNSPNLNDIAQVGNSFYIWNGRSWIGYSTSLSSGIGIKDDDVFSGTAATINFGDNLTVDFSDGVATIDATGGGGGGESYWTETSAGIHTLSNVGIGTTNPTSALTVKGNTSLETLNVSGVSTLTTLSVGDRINIDNFLSNVVIGISPNLGGNFNVQGPSYGNNLQISANGIDSGTRGNIIFYRKQSFQNQTEIATLYSDTGNLSINGILSGSGVTVTGSTFTNQLSVSGTSTLGIVTAGNIYSTGIITASSFVGDTLVSGISTFNSNVSVGGTISVDGGVQLSTNNETIVGTSATAGEIKRIGGAPFFYDGSAWREFVLSTGTPVSVPADTEWDNVILRSSYNIDFRDEKFEIDPVFVGSGATTVGSPRKYGSRSLKIDGSIGCGISYTPRSEYDFTGSWTIEFWIYFDSVPTDNVSLVSMISPDDNTKNWTFGIFRGLSITDFVWDNNNTTRKFLYGIANTNFEDIFVNQWRHLALVREDDGSLHFYFDGFEVPSTVDGNVFDNNIVNLPSQSLHIGGAFVENINNTSYNDFQTFDGFIDDMRITAGLEDTGQRYTSTGITTNFTPPLELPTTGTLSSYVQPPGDKYGEITLGGSPTWRGTSGVIVNQQSSGNYRVSFASTYANSDDYFVLSQAMDQGFASYVGVARSTDYVDFAINKQSDDTAVDTGSLSVQITNHN